jgi:hypothetical protein
MNLFNNLVAQFVGIVDFDVLAEEELAAMKQMGVNLVLSTDPVV